LIRYRERKCVIAGAAVFAGLDLGATRDLSVLVIVWQDSTGAFHVIPIAGCRVT
jgi:hypothetical protein